MGSPISRGTVPRFQGLLQLREKIDRRLIHLEGLRKEVEKTFPDARAFIRPGFDKIDLNG